MTASLPVVTVTPDYPLIKEKFTLEHVSIMKLRSVSVFELLKEEYVCPHCETKLTLCHAPPIHVGDGLGWGSEYLYICLNEECPLYVNGWDYIENQYGHVGSYRYMKLPDSDESYNMMVGSKDAFTGSIVDPDLIRADSKRHQDEKKAIEKLESCVEEKNLEPVMYLLLDEHVSLQVKKKAVELLTALNDVACVEPLRNHDFRDSHLEQDVNMAINSILKCHFLRECPYCAELVKNRAKVCKHCQKELC